MLVRLRVAIALLQPPHRSFVPPERNQRGLCFRLGTELDAAGQAGGSLTAMLNLAEKLQPDIPTLAASEATFQAAFAFC